MDRSAIEKIIEVSEPHIIEENGYKYSDKELNVISEPTVARIHVNTLSSLVDLLKAENHLFKKPILVHISNPEKVSVYSGVNPTDKNRETPYVAEFNPVEFRFGYWYSYEQMMIALKSKFVETPELNEVVKLLGTITEENNMKIEDDGFTQTVTVKKGIALKDNKAINPRVKLIPYSTFNEVPQPEREFLLRLDGSGEAALFEADGGAWQIEACENIAEYLEHELEAYIPNRNVIIVR